MTKDEILEALRLMSLGRVNEKVEKLAEALAELMAEKPSAKKSK